MKLEEFCKNRNFWTFIVLIQKEWGAKPNQMAFPDTRVASSPLRRCMGIRSPKTVDQWIAEAKFVRTTMSDDYDSKGLWYEINSRLLRLKNDAKEGKVPESNKHMYLSDHDSLKTVDQLVAIVNDILTRNGDQLNAFRQIAKYYKENGENACYSKIKNTRIIEDEDFTLQRMRKILDSKPNGDNTDSSDEKSCRIFMNRIRICYMISEVWLKWFNEMGTVYRTQLENLLGKETGNLIQSFLLLERISLQLAEGDHEKIWQSIESFGENDSGSSYFEFSRSIQNFEGQINIEDIRSLMSGRTLENIPSFLPCLIAVWFISETARNYRTTLTSLILLDLIQSGAECGTWYEWKNVLTHPNGKLGKCTDYYGDSHKNAQFGGIHPMSHGGSFIDSQEKIESKAKLNVLQQKEAHLIIDWLSRKLPTNYHCVPVRKCSEKALQMFKLGNDHRDKKSQLLDIKKAHKKKNSETLVRNLESQLLQYSEYDIPNDQLTKVIKDHLSLRLDSFDFHALDSINLSRL